MVQPFSCSMPYYERVLFVPFQAKADKGFSRKPPFCCAESSNNVTSYNGHMTRCFLYLRLLHRGQGSPQPSAPLSWQKKKSHSVNSQSQSMRRNGRGNTSKKPLQLFHRYPKKWTTFLPGTHKSRVPLPFK